MPFISRFNGYPSDAALTAIEGVKIVEITPPGSINGLGSGTVALVGEFLKSGSYTSGVVTSNVNVPTEVFSSGDILSQFGMWSSLTNPGGAFPAGLAPSAWDGNGFLAFRGKQYARLILVNVAQAVGTCTVTVAHATLTPEFTIPAGAKVQNAAGADIFALTKDINVKAADYLGSGPYTATYLLQPMRRVLGSALTPTADSFVVADAAAIAPSGVTLDCTLFSTVTDWTQAICESAYSNALDTLLNDSKPANEVSIVFSARHTEVIMGYLLNHATAAAAKGRGRIALVSPPTGTAKATAEGATTVGVGHTTVSRTDRVIYAYPGVQVMIPEIPTATVSAARPALQDWPFDASYAAVLSNLAEEQNPGVKNDWLGHVVGIESGVTGLVRADYEAFKRLGISAPRIDAVNGCVIQSGVVSVDPAAYPALKNVARRRMTDKITDDIAAALAGFDKALSTPTNRRAVGSLIRGYLEGLLSEDNPAKQRIAAYMVDEVSGNTPAALAQGIFVVIIQVQTLSSMDYIVLQAQIGETVTIIEQV